MREGQYSPLKAPISSSPGKHIKEIDPTTMQLLLQMMQTANGTSLLDTALSGSPMSAMSPNLAPASLTAPAPPMEEPPAQFGGGLFQPGPGKMNFDLSGMFQPGPDKLNIDFTKYGETWADPAATRNFPFPRNEDQTGAQQIAAGAGNGLLNMPQNLWHLYNKLFVDPIKPAVGGVVKGVEDFRDWMNTPQNELEAQKAAEAAAGQPAGTPKTFTPGLPQPGANGVSGSTVNKITGVESGGNPNARNPNSSAFGPGQFIKSTWLEFLRETNPEVLKSLGEEKALKLRSDPGMSQQATSWYAGKAVDVLDDLNLPATDANIYLHHFLGPGGLKSLMSADPNQAAADVLDPSQVKSNMSILGNGKTVGDVITWAQAKMGAADENGPMMPPNRPAPVMPDFTTANNWLDKAAPVPVDQETLQNMMLSSMLSGMGAGISGNFENGGQLFAGLAAGAGQGLSQGKGLQLQLQQAFNQQQADYASVRANVATQQANTLASGANAANETEFLNETDQFNAVKGFNDQQKARRSSKVIETSADGIWVQGADNGPISFIGSKANDQYKQLEEVSKALGADSMTAQTLKYNLMSQAPGMNLLTYQMELANDVIKAGMGPAVFGDAYNQAFEQVQKEAPSNVVADPKLMQDYINKAMASAMMAASNSAGNNDWIIQAATLGMPGALMLVQNGTFGE